MGPRTFLHALDGENTGLWWKNLQSFLIFAKVVSNKKCCTQSKPISHSNCIPITGIEELELSFQCYWRSLAAGRLLDSVA